MDEIDYAAERTEAFTLVALRMALVRPSHSHSTGFCAACLVDIEPERLKANPHARLCGDCAAEEEANERRRRRCGPR